MGRRLAWLLGFSLVAQLGGCATEVTPPDGVFICVDATECPDEYECRTDGYCYAVHPIEEGVEDAAADAAADTADAASGEDAGDAG